METEQNPSSNQQYPDMEVPPSTFERFSQWLKSSLFVKLVVVAILVGVLMVPTTLVSNLIKERQEMRDTAEEEVTANWGKEQKILGPVLSVPFYGYSAKKTSEREKKWAHFLPETVVIDGNIIPHKKNRGIYAVVLYNAKLNVKGQFEYPNLAALGIDSAQALLQEAIISIGMSDLKGIKENVKFTLNDKEYTFNPGVPVHDIFDKGLSFPVWLQPTTDGKYNFSYKIDVNGSTALNFEPFGKENEINLQSEWGSPSFQGDFLPDPEFTEISPQAFKARWKVLHLSRNYSQSGVGAYIPAAERSDFGVKLMFPVDEYSKIERSIKYALMFIILTFACFFFVEIFTKRKIHPIQYLLVGIALCMFYVLLLSISEHLPFNMAYLIGSALVVLLLTYYVYFVFRNLKLTALFSLILAALYFFYFSLLQLENYSLLLGSIGLFLILVIVLYLTRKIDWYNWNK